MTAQYDAGFLLNLPASEYLAFVSNMIDEDLRKRVYQQWCAIYPYMIMKYLKYMPFSEFFDQVTGRNIDMRDTDTIIEEIKALHNME